MGTAKTSDHFHITIKMPYPCQEHPVSFKVLNQDLRKWMFFALLQLREKANIQNIGMANTYDHIPIKIKMPNLVRNLERPPKPQIRFKGNGCSLYPQNQDREPTFRTQV